MATLEQLNMQNQGQEQERPQHTYENKFYIHLHDFQLKQHIRSDTQQPFWTAKLLSGTFIEHEGQRLDVSHYLFSMNQDPLVIHGEPGTPQCMRSAHFPDGWELNLRRVENVAKEGHDPIFEVTDRVEGVTPKALAEGIAEREAAFRSERRKTQEQEQPSGKEAAEKSAQIKKIERSAEPSL